MKRLFTRMTAICFAVIIAFAPVNANASTLIKRGSTGTEVKRVQTTLHQLGYYTYPKVTGYYGSVTESAVKRFQKANGLPADGIIGKKTMSTLLNNNIMQSVSGSAITFKAINTNSQYSGDLDWFTEVRDIWKRGMNAVITDVDTGKTFEVKRTYGTNHADIETLTKKDTEVVKDIWGGFSWQRRAVVVQIGQYAIAGSMTAMPHAGLDNKPEGIYVSGRSAGYGRGYNFDAIKGNGMNGHMDIHFKNSRTHSTNVTQKVHQDMVKKADHYIKDANISI